MALKMQKQIRDFLFIDAVEADKKEFNTSINKINIGRARITTITFILLELVIFLISCIVKRGNFLKKPDVYYGAMYLIMILVMTVFCLIFKKLGKNIPDNEKKILTMGPVFAALILLWCAGISLLDLLSDGQILIYVVAVISIAVTPIYRPITLLKVYLTVHIIFLLLLPLFQKSDNYLFGNYINSTTVLVISWIISYMRYRNRIEDFENKKRAKEKSRELKRLNKKLEEANRKLEDANHKLEILSRTDSLTEVYNRSVFNQLLHQEWDKCKAKQGPISLIMIDIDFFKAFNDNYGHQAGDECLKLVAGVLSDCAKPYTDSVIRYGGEEFTVILSDMSQEKAVKLAEDMRSKVESLKIQHELSTISQYVTISLGVYTLVPSDHLSMNEFVRTADKALYAAKNKERNKVMVS